MTEKVFAGDPNEERELDILAPERVATFVSYLASPAAAGISGQVFVVYGDMVALMDSPKVEQKFTRSEEHTSELQSLMRRSYAVFCLKKKKIIKTTFSNHLTTITKK